MHNQTFSHLTQYVALPCVLIVESDYAIASMLQLFLRDAHIPTMVAHTKRDALLALKGLRPLLILINTHLRDGCGITLYDELCMRSPHMPIPTLILSTNLPWHTQQLSARSLPSLALPLDLNTFLDTIYTLLPTSSY